MNFKKMTNLATNENINEYTLSFSGKSNVSGQLNRGIDYVFKVTATIPKAEIEDCEDGKIDIHYKAKVITCETESEGKKVKTVAKSTWSESQKTRWAIKEIQSDKGIEMDGDEYYSLVQKMIRVNLEEIINKYL